MSCLIRALPAHTGNRQCQQQQRSAQSLTRSKWGACEPLESSTALAFSSEVASDARAALKGLTQFPFCTLSDAPCLDTSVICSDEAACFA